MQGSTSTVGNGNAGNEHGTTDLVGRRFDELVDRDADQVRWNLLGFTPEFSRFDKVLYVATYVWHGFWLVLFMGGNVYFLSVDPSETGWKPYEGIWIRFWWWFIWIHLGVSVIIVAWFTVGGMLDLRQLFRDLQTAKRDSHDDGTVRSEEEAT